MQVLTIVVSFAAFSKPFSIHYLAPGALVSVHTLIPKPHTPNPKPQPPHPKPSTLHSKLCSMDYFAPGALVSVHALVPTPCILHFYPLPLFLSLRETRWDYNHLSTKPQPSTLNSKLCAMDYFAPGALRAHLIHEP